MRNRFDKLAKQIGQEALGRSGVIIADGEISPETQHADLCHEPDPSRGVERRRLGLLGRLAAVRCLIEIYGHAPGPEEFRACLAKHIAFWRRCTRKARASNRKRKQGRRPSGGAVAPFLWVITAGVPVGLVTELKLEAASGWPAGVYMFGGEVLRVGLVVASKLPRERSTLLVRLMAAGPLLEEAIPELFALPPDANERVVAEPILVDLQYRLGLKADPTPDEQEYLVIMHKTVEQQRAESRAEGRAEGRAQGRAEALLTVLRARGIAVPNAARKRILAEKDPERLTRWLERAGIATSVRDVIGIAR